MHEAADPALELKTRHVLTDVRLFHLSGKTVHVSIIPGAMRD